MTDQPPEDPEIELEPFSHILVEAIEAGSGIKPIIILIHKGRASFTRLGLVRDGSTTGFNQAVERHLDRLANLTVEQRLAYHAAVDVTVDAPFLATRLAETDFGYALAAEGQPVVALDENGAIREYTGDETDLEGIRTRHLAASPGPWSRSRDTIVDAFGHPVALVGYAAFPGRDPQVWHAADAELLTHAWADIRALLAEVSRLRDRLAETD